MNFALVPGFPEGETALLQLKSELLETNKKSAEYGLVLSEQDALMLVVQGKEAIALQDRVEFGKSITVKLVEKFMQSTYISPVDYAQTIAMLLEIFYEAKEESLDVLTDEEVIDILYDFFERESGGDIETLQTRDMYYLCRKIRSAATGVTGEEEELEEDVDE